MVCRRLEIRCDEEEREGDLSGDVGGFYILYFTRRLVEGKSFDALGLEVSRPNLIKRGKRIETEEQSRVCLAHVGILHVGILLMREGPIQVGIQCVAALACDQGFILFLETDQWYTRAWGRENLTCI